MIMKNCKNCDKNYLYKIFTRCMNYYDNTNDALDKFDKICLRSGDPRNPLSIITSMYNYRCDDCEKYREYYNNYIF